jgi:hypothetical protein
MEDIPLEEEEEEPICHPQVLECLIMAELATMGVIMEVIITITTWVPLHQWAVVVVVRWVVDKEHLVALKEEVKISAMRTRKINSLIICTM